MNPICVLVLRSHVGGTRTWAVLNRYWSHFGDYPLHITTFMSRSFTYDDLVDVLPSVIICSDTAGCPGYFSADEVDALKRYISSVPCCHLLGTYAAFYHVEGSGRNIRQFDNRQISPLFGFKEELTYASCKLKDSKMVLKQENKKGFLWNQLKEEHELLGYKSCKVPKGGSWLEGNNLIGTLPGAELIASDNEGKSVIIGYHGKFHSSIYISGMPEYQANKINADMQLVYNCIVALYVEGLTNRMEVLCLKSISQQPKLFAQTLLDNKCIEQLPQSLAEIIVKVLVARVKLTNKQLEYLGTVGYVNKEHIPNKHRNGSPTLFQTIRMKFEN
ncbi:Uncharacterized protein QTN25_003428 [Entamoeba marina]